jgi:NAD(P)-dependent dehydrogenase (short-subunit alcohol dehydrogenase family)
VVSVAGIRGAGIIAQASDDVLEQMVTINLLAPARLIQAALPLSQEYPGYLSHD